VVVRRAVWRCNGDEGYHEVVECAVDRTGTSPASVFLDHLASGTWADDPEYDPPADREQIHDHAKLLIEIEHVGTYGQPRHSTVVNHLRNGVWEFKFGARRLTYWDTPGEGSWVAKPRYGALAERVTPVPGPDEVPGGGYWWYPDLDAILRLGCAWPKEGQQAPQDKITEAERLREEDCAHDRRT
jgi:hypothetical protein